MGNELLLEDASMETETVADDSLFNITSYGLDMTIRELIMMYSEGDLEKPEMQRHYVWTRLEASRFIDSILLGLPVPSIFLAKTKDHKTLIVDGYQRIMTVHDYVNGIFSGDGKPFSLSDSFTIYERWRGKAFTELSTDEQRKIRIYTIHAIVFEQKYPRDDSAMYQIFERINTSGRALKSQEIRNCVYHGKFNQLLIELNDLEIWRDILKLSVPDSRMLDVELILRAFAFADLALEKEEKLKQINLLQFLNYFMASNSELQSMSARDFREQFVRIMTFLHGSIGDNLFRNAKTNPDGNLRYSKKINPNILDSIYSAAVVYIQKHGFENIYLLDLKSNYEELIRDGIYQTSISIRTTSLSSIVTRIKLAHKYLFGEDYEWQIPN